MRPKISNLLRYSKFSVTLCCSALSRLCTLLNIFSMKNCCPYIVNINPKMSINTSKKKALTQPCPEHCSTWLSGVLVSVQLDSALSRTWLSLTQRCSGQRSNWLSPVPNIAQLNSAVFLSAFSLTQPCAEHGSAWLSGVLVSVQLDSALSRTWLSLTQQCSGQRLAWLSPVPNIAQRCSGQHSAWLSPFPDSALFNSTFNLWRKCLQQPIVQCGS